MRQGVGAAVVLLFTACAGAKHPPASPNQPVDVTPPPANGHTAADPSSDADPSVSSPDQYQLIAETAHLRALDVRWKPGRKDRPHTVPRSAGYVLNGGLMKAIDATSIPKDFPVPTGDVMYQGPAKHRSFENQGQTEVHVLLVEARGDMTPDPNDVPEPSPAPPPAEASPGDPPTLPPEAYEDLSCGGPPMPGRPGFLADDDPLVAASDFFSILGENDKFRILLVSLAPGKTTEPHRLRENVFHVLEGKAVRFNTADGLLRDVAAHPGHTFGQVAATGHTIENRGPAELRAVIFEWKGEPEAR